MLHTGGPGSGYSDADSRSGGGGGGAAAAAASRGAWQQAHAMRRRLDRVNRTASLVSYEERAESAVPRAKAQRVRRRMHYAMSLQGFQVSRPGVWSELLGCSLWGPQVVACASCW